MAFKMNDTALYKRAKGKNSCSFKKNHDSESKSDTLDITLADNLYRKEKVDSGLISFGYDPATRRVTGKTGIGGKIDKTEVSKIDQSMFDDSVMGSQVPVPTTGYLGGMFQKRDCKKGRR